MHELSIAQSLVELIEDELACQVVAHSRGSEMAANPRVDRVVVKVGVLSGVVPAALQSAFAVAAAHSSIRGASLIIDLQPAVIWCQTCAIERTLATPQAMRCPDCGHLSARLIAGKELELTSIEVHDDIDAADTSGANADS